MAKTAGEIITAYIRAIETRDMANATPFLTEDTIFDNFPLKPPGKITIGATAIGQRLQRLLSRCEKVEWEVVRQIEQGDTVFNERVDRFWFKSGMFPKSNLLEWPVCTRWELEGGKIKLWRDYYEPNLNEPQLGVDIVEFGRILGNNYGAV